MPTEAIQTDYSPFDTWSLEKRLEVMLESNISAVQAIRSVITPLTEASEGIRERLLRGGRLVYIGAGTSGRLALQDAIELEPTFGFERTLVLLAGSDSRENRSQTQAQEDAEDDEDAGVAAVRNADVEAKDAVIALAASGRTPYTLAALREATRRGAFSVGITNNADTPLLHAAEVGICIDSGPEVIAGSTRMAAGTAQKVVLNLLSSVPMPELGAVYKNLMVGMLPVNEKLYARAVQITVAATDADAEAARSVLETANWNIRQAALMLKTNLDAEASAQLLKRHGGRLQTALEQV